MLQKNLLTLCTNVHNKLESLSLACFTGLVIFVRKTGAYLSEAPFKYSFKGRLLTLLTSLRLGQKGLTKPNTLAYYEH